MWILYVAVLWKYQGLIILVVALWLWYKAWTTVVGPWLRNRRARREAERECLLLRADYENKQWLADGIYEGSYPAYTMPLTDEYSRLDRMDGLGRREWYDYDDHDDGMTEWK